MEKRKKTSTLYLLCAKKGNENLPLRRESLGLSRVEEELNDQIEEVLSFPAREEGG